MQFLPATWAAYGQGDINSNHDAIAAAARYLHANGAPERLDDAIFRYNHSTHYVAAIKAYAEPHDRRRRAFRGYYEWQVLYRTAGRHLGVADRLPVGAAGPGARLGQPGAGRSQGATAAASASSSGTANFSAADRVGASLFGR